MKMTMAISALSILLTTACGSVEDMQLPPIATPVTTNQFKPTVLVNPSPSVVSCPAEEDKSSQIEQTTKEACL